MANIYDTLIKLGSGLQQAELTDNDINQTTQPNVETDEPFIYDGDTTYANGKGSRMLGIDTPEMSSAVALKTERLAKARESKVGSFASKATAGEAAKLEAQLSVLDFDGIDSEGAFVKKDAYGRDLVQNDAYKNRMIEKGYAVPTFFGDENDASAVESMIEAKQAKRGLWADPEYAKEMQAVVDKRIINNDKASDEVRELGRFANYDGTLTKEDFLNRDTSASSWVDGVQAYVMRETAPIRALWSNLGDVEAAKKQIEYEQENADIMVGYDPASSSLPERIRRAMSSGTEDLANKVAGLAGDGIESLGSGVRGIKNLDKEFVEKENARLAKYGESVSDFRANVVDTLGVDEVGSWLQNVGKGIQKDTVEHVKANKGSKLSGYDTTNVSELQEEIKNTIEKDGFITAIGNALTDVRSLEVLAGSLPEMMALAASVGGMAVVNVNHNINVAEEKLGRKLTSAEKVRSAIVSIVSTYLDRLGDKLAISGMTPAKSALKSVVDNAPVAVKNGLASTFGKGILKIGEAPLRLAGAGLVEGVTEYGQTLGETAAQNPRVFSEGFTAEDLSEGEVAGVLGTAVGGHIATPSIAKDVLTGSGSFKDQEEISAENIRRETAKAKETSIENLANNMKNKEEFTITPSDSADILGIESVEQIFNSSQDSVEAVDRLNNNKLKIMEDVYMFDPSTRQVTGIKDFDKVNAATAWFEEYAQVQADAKGKVPSHIQKELDYINEANLKYTAVAPETLESKAADVMVGELKQAGSTNIEADVEAKIDDFINTYKLNESMKADQVTELKSNIKKQVLDKFSISGMIDIPGVTYELDNEAFSELVRENAGLKTNLDSRGMKRGGTTVEVGSITNEELSNILAGEGSSFDLSHPNTKLRERRIRKLDPLEARNVTDTLVDVNTKMDVSIAKNKDKAGKLFKGGDVLGNMKRLMAIAINTIDSQTASDTEQRASTTTDDSMIKADQYWASKNNVIEQIGKDYASSHGLKLTGNKIALAKAYRDLGRFAIDLLKDADLVQESDEMWTRVGKTVGEDNNPLGVTNTKGVSLKQSKDSLTDSNTLLTKDKGVRLIDTNDRVSSTDVDKKTQKYSSKIGDAVKRVAGLMLPGTERAPFTDKPGDRDIKVAEGIQIDNKSEEIIKKTDNKAHKAKKSGKMLQILEYLKTLNNTTPGGLSAAIRKNELLKDFLLLNSNGSALLEESNSGSIQGKLDNLIGLLDNLKTISLEDGVYYTLQVDINDRLTVEQTVSNYQGDKVYARPLMGVGEYKIPANDTGARDVLIESIIDEIATKNQQKTMSNEDILSYYSELYSKIELASNGNIGDLMEIVSNTPGLKHLKRKGGFRILSALQGARDVVSSGNGNITTEYIPEKDASASGVFNYMMNLAGRDVELFKQRLLDLGVTIDGISEINTTDAYTILKKLVDNLIKEYEARDPDIGTTGKSADVEAVKKLRNTLNDDKFMRDLAKYPIMTWFYSAGQTSIVENLVLEATKELIGKGIDGDPDVLAYISNVTGKNNMTASDVKNIAKGSDAHKALRAELAKVGNVFYDNLTKAFPEVEKNKKEMEELFDFLEREGKANGVDYWEGRIRTAISVLHGDPKTTSLYKRKNKALNLTPEEKIAQGLTTEDESLSLITVMDKAPNKTSMMAFFAHLVDSAQAITWLDSYESDYGMQSKHDGFSGRPQDLIQAQKEVEKLNNRIAVEYDFMNEMAVAMRDTADRMEKDLENYVTPSKVKELERRIKNLREKATQVEAINNPRIEAKKELFKNAQTALFGKTGLDSNTNIESTKAVEVKPEEVKASEITKVKDNIFDVISNLDTLDERKNDILVNKDNLKIVSVVGSTKDELLKSKEFGKEFKDRVKSGTSFTYNGTVYIGKKTIDGIDEITNKKAEAEQILDVVYHELEHAAIDSYIDNEASGAIAKEVATISTILERASNGKTGSKVSPRAKQRIEYVLSKIKNDNNQAIKELVAISQEDTVAAEVLDELNRMAGIKTGGVLSRMISSIWNKVKELMQSTPIDTLLDNADVYSLSVAIESIRQQARGIEGVAKVKNGTIPDKTTPFDAGAVNKIVSINGEKISISNYTKNIDPIC